MWTARVLMESGKEEGLHAESVGRRQSLTSELIPLAHKLAENSGLRVPWHLLDATASNTPSVWADPISSWAGRAAEELQTLFVTRSRGENGEVALESKAHGIQFWHENTAVVIAIPEGLTLFESTMNGTIGFHTRRGSLTTALMLKANCRLPSTVASTAERKV
jgi:hypothetical protein